MGKWATDLEVFAISLLFNIDIGVYPTKRVPKYTKFWNSFGWIFCQRLDELLKERTSNGL